MKHKNIRTDELSLDPAIAELNDRVGIAHIYMPSAYINEITEEALRRYLEVMPPIAVTQDGQTRVVARAESLMIARQRNLPRIPVLIVDGDPVAVFITAELHAMLLRGCRQEGIRAWRLTQALDVMGVDHGLPRSRRRLAAYLDVDRRHLK